MSNLFILGSNALLFLETVEQPLYFTRCAPTEAHSVISDSKINTLLDWYVVRGVDDVQFRVALLLQPENKTISEYTEPSLVFMGDISSQCRSISSSSLLLLPSSSSSLSSSSTSDPVNTASVTVFTSSTAVHLLYICGDDTSGALHVLIAQWRDGNLIVSVDETLMSLSMAKSWLLPRDVGAASTLLIYVVGIDGATSMILLEGMNSLGAHPSSITRMKLPDKFLVGETELVTSCFLPSVGVSGLVRYLRSDGTFHFELYRIFSHEQSAELLLETSTAIFTDLSAEERQYCSLSSRVSFTDCRFTLVGLETLQVDVAVTAILKSPTAAGLRDLGGWVKCGETLLTGSAIIQDGGRRVLVTPLRRLQFKSLVSREDINEEEGKIKGHMGRCIFDQSDSKLNCSVKEKPHYAPMRGVSRRCTAARMWWQPATTTFAPDRYLCKYVGVTLTEILTFSFIFFTTAFGVQLVAKMLPIWVGYLG
ncbi:uncharacterized protein TM35_000111150 [Trypanosoma theileri]|uniref:Uncharacterized protein n=1 Tax=Trypanosoma theileri TaxID=67003 RepID=A0A1X0NYA0_9TRYP|nr:uncharacterized protein TM35_000111150 [Trypanosoma theileri]ORC89581.1 hypothetical protein TM35_000111150 [Trypanosoma theileri]